jgi:hypothetical protein
VVRPGVPLLRGGRGRDDWYRSSRRRPEGGRPDSLLMTFPKPLRSPTLARVALLAGGCTVFALVASACGPPATSLSATTTTSITHASAGKVGSTQTLNDGTGDTIAVTLLKFEDPAQPDGRRDDPPAGDELAEVLFEVKTVSGTFTDDAETAVAVVGANGDTYSADSAKLFGCAPFASGQFSLATGHSLTGCIAVPLPRTVKPSKVEYDAGYVGTTGIWNP